MPYSYFEPVSINRNLGLVRLDFQPQDEDRFMARLVFARGSRPDFIFSPYKEFNSELHDDSTGVALSYIRSFGPRATNELKFGWRNTDLGWDRPHPWVPTLRLSGVSLPGSPAFYEFNYRDSNWEVSDSLVLHQSRHLVTVGAGLLLRRPESLLSFGRDGEYSFDGLADFAADAPSRLRISVDRRCGRGNTRDSERKCVESLPFKQSPFDRRYANNQFFAFVQDSLKLSPRLGMSLGLRYESFGTLTNIGRHQDGYLHPGAGETIIDRIKESTFDYDQSRRAAYRPDRNNWASRLGLTYDLFGRSETILRAAYGIFYDRPFDNLVFNTRTNGLGLASFKERSNEPPVPSGYLAPRQEVLRNLGEKDPGALGFPNLQWVDEGLRSPYVQSWLVAVQHQLSRDLSVEVSHMGSAARKLATTDIVNRLANINGHLPENIVFRSDSGSSTYTALGALARYRSRRGQLQLAYTYSHSIDNQSEPLLGDFFNLTFAKVSDSPSRQGRAAFTRRFDSRVDRGNSDFDQRHNLVLYSLWELPGSGGPEWFRGFSRGWQFAQLAAFRSGFPYTVLGSTTSQNLALNEGGFLHTNRPHLVRRGDVKRESPVAGGVQIVNPDAFQDAIDLQNNNPLLLRGVLGNLGRNSLIGPGFWNVDFSLAKSVAAPWLGETGRVQLRADFFNVFNHANLGNPGDVRIIKTSQGGSNVVGETFGHALYGRQGRKTGFPAAVPLNETPRQIQLQLKLYF